MDIAPQLEAGETAGEGGMEACTHDLAVAIKLKLELSVATLLSSYQRAHLLSLDAEGNTALHFACFHDNLPALDMIMRLAATEWVEVVSARNKKGEMPIDLAKKVGAGAEIIQRLEVCLKAIAERDKAARRSINWRLALESLLQLGVAFGASTLAFGSSWPMATTASAVTLPPPALLPPHVPGDLFLIIHMAAFLPAPAWSGCRDALWTTLWTVPSGALLLLLNNHVILPRLKTYTQAAADRTPDFMGGGKGLRARRLLSGGVVSLGWGGARVAWALGGGVVWGWCAERVWGVALPVLWVLGGLGGLFVVGVLGKSGFDVVRERYYPKKLEQVVFIEGIGWVRLQQR
ncbi:hypothetical protein T484DRAFT_2341365 [Baffinella frigidus]|nr:hypothetical protein T484DRAFT_2341365 [Cryptophyta sp. CCMP2293]